MSATARAPSARRFMPRRRGGSRPRRASVRSASPTSRRSAAGAPRSSSRRSAANRRAPDEYLSANWRSVTPGYFAALGVALKKGRLIAESDGEREPRVVVITETMARQIWPGVDPVGQQITLGGNGGPTWTVVGIVGDIRDQLLQQEPAPHDVSLVPAGVVGHHVAARARDGRSTGARAGGPPGDPRDRPALARRERAAACAPRVADRGAAAVHRARSSACSRRRRWCSRWWASTASWHTG